MKRYVIAAAAAGLFAGMASAGGGADAKAAWSSLDADQDGVITRSEAQGSAALTEKFDQYDANRDGVLSKKEFEASQTAMKAPTTHSSSAPTEEAPSSSTPVTPAE